MLKSNKDKKLGADALWEYALRTLDRRPYTMAELRKKLSLRAETPAARDQTMAKLQEYGLVDDKKFAEVFATSRLSNQGFGSRRVMRDLQVKNVPREIAEQAIKQAYAGTEETELVKQFLERKFRTRDLTEYLSDEKNLAAAYRKLRLAGFGPAASINTLKQYARRAEELEGMETEPGDEEL
jgi:regulatory protein